MTRKVTALLLAALMFLVLFAGCQSSNQSAGTTAGTTAAATTAAGTTAAGTTAAAATTAATTAAATTAATTAPAAGEDAVTVDMWIIEHPSYLYTPGLLCEQLINEYVGIYFNVTPFQTGVLDKINLGLASGELPDIYFNTYLSDCTEWGMKQGALVNVTEYFDKMPNYVAWEESMGDYPSYFYCADGGLYMMPQYGFGTASNSTFWIYRKDLFEANDIPVPNNEVEVYDACMKLKELYPDSFPFACRSFDNMGIMSRIVYQWGGGFNMYYSNDDQAWTYGQVEPECEAAIAWLNQLYSAKLMPDNILSLDTAGWQELITTNRGFMFNDYQARIDFYNSPMRETDPSVTFAYMKPFEGGGSGIRTFNPQTQLIINGYSLFSTSKHIDKIIEFFDWLYTDEAYIAMNWGREGESFVTNPDGTRSYTEIKQGDSGFIYQEKYSFFQRGFWTICDPAAMTAAGSDELLEAVSHVKEDAGEYAKPSCALNEERSERVNVLNEAINTHAQENVGKFITGQRPMSEYADFVNELYGLGLQEMIDLYNAQQAENDAALG